MGYGKEKYLVIETKEDILKRLIILDESISELNRKNKTKFVIFGGAAFLLKTKFRPTSDIDVYLLDESGDAEIESLLNEVDIHTTLSRVLEIPPIGDFVERMDMIDVDFENIEVYVASAYDLIISKLFSTRGDKDEQDLIRTDLIDQVDIEQLREMVDDFKTYAIFPKERYNDLEEVLEKRKEHLAITQVLNN